MTTRLLDRVSPGATDDRPKVAATSPEYDRVRRELHTELIESMDLTRLRSKSREELEPQLRTTLTAMLEGRQLPIAASERGRLIEDILDELVGLGPIERLMRDPLVSDILINGPDLVVVEKQGRLYDTDVRFDDSEHLMRIVERIVSAVGRRVDEASPMVDARLMDGSRVNAIIPPLAVDGPMISIRRFGVNPITTDDLVRLGTIPEPILRLLDSCVKARLNVLISGGTGTGKTTLLNALSAFIPPTERVITIEDAAELRLQQRHVVRLETRPPNLEGAGEVTTRDLVRNALRMRPDRIIVGEIRGDEAIDMLQAMNTGHEGSICTIHANSPRHAFRRLETMVGLGLGNIAGVAIREMIGDALDVVLQVSRLQDGTRRLISVMEVTGMEHDVITTQEIFQFRQRTIDPQGRVRGTFSATGIRPAFAEKMAAYGVPLPLEALRLSLEV